MANAHFFTLTLIRYEVRKKRQSKYNAVCFLKSLCFYYKNCMCKFFLKIEHLRP